MSKKNLFICLTAVLSVNIFAFYLYNKSNQNKPVEELANNNIFHRTSDAIQKQFALIAQAQAKGVKVKRNVASLAEKQHKGMKVKRHVASIASKQTKGRKLASYMSAHHRGSFAVEGPFDLNEKMIATLYKGLERDKFGTFQINMPVGVDKATGEVKYEPLMERYRDGYINYIREAHYRLFRSVDRNEKKITAHHVYPAKKKQKYQFDIGIRPIPIVDGSYLKEEDAPRGFTAKNANDEKVEVVGSEAVDKIMYESFSAMKKDGKPYAADAPLFGLIAYYHPETYKGNFDKLSDSELLKSENGMTHLGAYIGNGQTRNSPTNYHAMTWEVSGYPTNLTVVEYEGAKSPEIFNTNAMITLKILNEFNEGPQFPMDYKFDYFRAISLKETFKFYRAWIDTEWKLEGHEKTVYQELGENKNKVYCAEHLTIALNVALNLPQNEKGYIEVYGEEVGRDLWQKMLKRWNEEDVKVNIAGKRINLPFAAAGGLADDFDITTAIPEGDAVLKPLWKYESKSAQRILPSKWDDYNRALAWPSEKLPDLLRDFLEQYANWMNVGAVWSTAVMLKFSEAIKERSGLAQQQYVGLALPVIIDMYIYHMALKLAITADQNEQLQLPKGPNLKKLQKTNPEMAKTVKAQLDAGKVKIKQALEMMIFPKVVEGFKDASLKVQIPEKIVNMVIGAVNLQKEKVIQLAMKYRQNKDLQARLRWAREEYKRDILDELEKARRVPVAVSDIEEQLKQGKKFVNEYTPPAVVHRVISGIHNHNPKVKFTTIGTVMDAREIEPMIGTAYSVNKNIRKYYCPYGEGKCVEEYQALDANPVSDNDNQDPGQ